MADFDGEPIIKTKFTLPPVPRFLKCQLTSSAVSSVSATSKAGGYYDLNTAWDDLPEQTDGQHLGNVQLFYTCYGFINDGMLKVSYCKIDKQAEFEKWSKARKENTLQRLQDSMISISDDAWWSHHVRGTVYLYGTVAVKHILAREYLNLTHAEPGESAQ